MNYLYFALFGILYSICLGSPLISYFIGHKLPSYKCLFMYSLFWISVCFATHYKLVTTPNTQPPAYIPTWKVGTFLILLSCTTAIIAAITKTIILYLKFDKKQILIINLISLFAVPLVARFVIEFPPILIRALVIPTNNI